MKEKNDQAAYNREKEKTITDRGNGPQGADKAPGEEPSENNVQNTQQTQKGKKVDGDPSKESDQPIEQDI